MRFSGSIRRSLLTAVSAASLALVAGCADGPAWRLGFLSPWARRHWADEAKYGPTIYDQLDDLSSLRRQVPAMGPAEQETLAQELVQRLGQSQSLPLRLDIIRTLGEFSAPSALNGLRMATQDGDPQIRIAACRAWGRRGDHEALQALAQATGSDTDLDVRMAAAREIAAFEDPAAINALGLALNDTDPALQRRAIESLRQVSGRDYGQDVSAWRSFVAGNPPPEPSISLSERLRRLF